MTLAMMSESRKDVKQINTFKGEIVTERDAVEIQSSFCNHCEAKTEVGATSCQGELNFIATYAM